MADEYMPVTLDIDEDMEISFHTDDVMTADLGEIASGAVLPIKANYNQTNPNAIDYIIGRENILGKDELASVTEEILAEAKASGEFDGKDGYTPIKGIDYFDGKDGYTPIKGTDYWTDADKASIVTDVINALPTWEGGSY